MTAFLIILLGLLPAFIRLAFNLNEDNRPETKKQLI
jgi:hypothetical protein